jgi:hypothetical protein
MNRRMRLLWRMNPPCLFSTASNTARSNNPSALAAPSNAGQAEQIISLMAEIAALNEGIWARDAILEALKPTSLQTLLRLGSLTLKQIGTSSSHLNVKGHKIAKATKTSIVLCQNMGISKLPQGLSSKFLAWNSVTGDEKEVSIGTEADVTALVTCLVCDASRILNFILGNFKIHELQERSLFSGRPDILVVYSTMYGIPLMVIKVKKPLPGRSNSTQHGRVLGQVYDYAKFLDAIGSPLPFVILTSFVESRICWNGNSKDGKETNEFNEKVDIASPPVDSPPCQKTNRDDGPPVLDSPPTLIEPTESDYKAKSPVLFQQDVLEQTLLVSERYKPHELVYLFCNAIFRAHTALQCVPCKATIYDLAWGKMYLFPKVVCFQSNKKVREWGSLTFCQKQEQPATPAPQSQLSSPKSIRKQPQPAKRLEQYYYVIGKLGSGATSNVWHALDSNGNEVAIKMYAKTTDDEGQMLTAKEFETQANVAVKTEGEETEKLQPILGKQGLASQAQ